MVILLKPHNYVIFSRKLRRNFVTRNLSTIALSLAILVILAYWDDIDLLARRTSNIFAGSSNEVPFMKLVPFRTIGHFDRPPFKFPKLSHKTEQHFMEPTLMATRFGRFEHTLRHRELVVVIPTIYRPKTSYLVPTIRSFFNRLSAEERQRMVMLVSINEINETSSNFTHATVNNLVKEFQKEISSGHLEIISPPAEFYMDLANLLDLKSPDLGDIPARVYWRSKQVIDFSFMFTYAYTQQMGDYLLLLEDDVETMEKSIVNTTLSYRRSVTAPLTVWYEFCSAGAIGKMYPMHLLPSFVNVMTSIFYVEPVDWIFEKVAELYACRHFQQFSECQQAKRNFIAKHPRQLFRHVAKVSTKPDQPEPKRNQSKTIKI